MARKKSVKKCASDFRVAADSTVAFVNAFANSSPSDEHLSNAYDFAIIRLYRDFELLVLGSLVGAINNDSTTLSKKTGVQFPRHLTDEVCEYLLIRDGYFDFKGRDGLIATVKKVVPDTHYLPVAIRAAKYRDSLERLCALRNLAAHASTFAKAKAKDVLKVKKLRSAGSWLKRQSRFSTIVDRLKDLSIDIETAAPF